MKIFDEAVGVLLLGQPFFGQLLLKMEHVIDESIPTLCVTRKALRYNPTFLEKFTLDEVVFMVAHEVMHQAWQHLPRVEYYHKSGIGPDGKPLDHHTFNQALDYPMNHALVVSKVGTPMPKDKFPLCLDPQRFPESMSPEEVYCILRKDQEDNPGKKPDGSQPLDEHDGITDADAVDAISPADVVAAAEAHNKIKGSYPAGIERLLGHIKKPDHSPWRLLRSFVTSSMPGRDASSWRRLQRRMIVRGVGMPGQVQQGAGRIGIVGDTSGSIGEEMLALFGGHMASIMADAKPQEVRIYWTDMTVNQVDVVKTPSQLQSVMSKPIKGGGGTHMPNGVAAAEADGCDCIVVLTDGYTAFCDSTKPLIWAITTQVEADGNGRTIHI